MPNIVIKEYDLTKPGVTPYTNFAVVVPGYVASEKEEAFLSACDENGILEVSRLSGTALNRDGFNDLIGKVAISKAVGELGISPTCVMNPAKFEDIQNGLTASAQFDYYKRAMYPDLRKIAQNDTSGDAYFEYSTIYLYPGDTATISIIKGDEELAVSVGAQSAADMQIATYSNGQITAGRAGTVTLSASYEDAEEVSHTIECTIIVETAPTAANLYKCEANETHEAGRLKTKLYTFVLVSPTDVFDSNSYYARVKAGNEGVDPLNSLHYGNQIAYELIKMGYTVLYKGLSLTEKVSTINDSNWWSCLTDKSLYDFRYIINGLVDGTIKTSCDNIISNIATTRGDCTALIDVDSAKYLGKSQGEALNGIISDVNGHSNANTYTAIFAPLVTFDLEDDTDYGNNKTFPAYFYYLACAAYAAETFNEWYAIAGYTRGICGYSIKSTGCKFGEAAIQALEPRIAGNEYNLGKAINLITKIKSQHYLWGNRTAKPLETELKASHFLNVRQLCTSIKKQVYVACRRFTFDPNSDLLWINFCNALRPTLEKMKGDQGITDYRFIKLRTSRKGILTAKIRIVPIEAVEDFEIKLTLEDSLGGTVVEIEDEAE